MKKIILLLAITGILSAQEHADSGITFEHGTWSEAIKKAKKQNKLIMLDAYASWCGPCKWMAKNIFPKQDVGAFYNSNFINVKIDMEKGEGIQLSQKYGVMAYPTFFFIDGSGAVVHQVCGGQEAEEFIQSGKNALNEQTRISTLENKFSGSPKNPELASLYFNSAEKACIDVEPRVRSYLEGITPSDYINNTNFELIEKFIMDYNHVSVANILNEYDAFSTKFTKERIDNKLKNVYAGAILSACKKGDEGLLSAVQSSYRKQKNSPSSWLNDFSDMMWADAKNDTVAYFPAAVKFCNANYREDWQQLNSMAWTFYERTSNENYLSIATDWVLKSIQLQKEYANMDTYAALLYKRKKYPDAKKVAEEAIALGKQSNEPTVETEALLEKINAEIKK
jgi:thioredoxin-related protein